MKAKYVGVKTALTKAYDGDHLESLGNYSQALQCYKDAIEMLIPVTEGMAYMLTCSHTTTRPRLSV